MSCTGLLLHRRTVHAQAYGRPESTPPKWQYIRQGECHFQIFQQFIGYTRIIRVCACMCCACMQMRSFLFAPTYRSPAPSVSHSFYLPLFFRSLLFVLHLLGKKIHSVAPKDLDIARSSNSIQMKNHFDAECKAFFKSYIQAVASILAVDAAASAKYALLLPIFVFYSGI